VQSVTEKTKPLNPDLWVRFDAVLDDLLAIRPKLDAKEWERVIERVRDRALSSARNEALARLAEAVRRNQGVADRSSAAGEHLTGGQA
jgi:hypothetical protein